MNDQTIETLSGEIHQNAVDHGWWEGGPRPITTIAALIHSEISEALEAFRNADKDNFGEELADVAIRALDALGGRDKITGNGMMNTDPSERREPVPDALCDLHSVVSVFSRHGSRMKTPEGMDTIVSEYTRHILDRVESISRDNGIDLVEQIKRKHAKNKARPYRHGGKAC